MANRFFTLLTAREAVATATLTSWALAEEIESVDSATRSYTAWIQAVVCETDPTNGVALDSATCSYIACARHAEVGEACRRWRYSLQIGQRKKPRGHHGVREASRYAGMYLRMLS